MKKTQKIISLNDSNNKYCVLDTETIHSGRLEKEQVIAIKDIVEIAWAMVDCDGVEIEGSRKGFIVKEFWENKQYLLSENYEQLKNGTIRTKQNFAINKIVKWEQALANGVLEIKSWGAIMKILNSDLKNYGVNLFSAYNILFDRTAIVNTSQIIPYKNYCPQLWKIDFLDIMEIVGVIVKQKKFLKWSDNHKSITPKGNYKVSAEAIYRSITNNSEKLETIIPDSSNWSETHLAIEDIVCEIAILRLAIALARRKRDIKVNINCYGNWSKLNKLIKANISKRKTKQKQTKIELETIGG